MADPLAADPLQMCSDCNVVADLPGKLRLIGLMGRGGVCLTMTNDAALELAGVVSAGLRSRARGGVDPGPTMTSLQLSQASARMRADEIEAALQRLHRVAWIAALGLTGWVICLAVFLAGPR